MKHFQALKEAVAGKVAGLHPGVPDNPTEWRRAEIELLQHELAVTVQGRISEKWFYTHFKQQQDRLPRIDMLDMLAAYVGKANWRTFVAEYPQFPHS